MMATTIKTAPAHLHRPDAPLGSQGRTADEGKGLIAAGVCTCVHFKQIKVIAPRLEITDHIAARSAKRAGRRQKNEVIGPGASRQTWPRILTTQRLPCPSALN